jgi:hypothetical protein
MTPNGILSDASVSPKKIRFKKRYKKHLNFNYRIRVMVFNNISVILWRSVLFVEET